MSNQIDLKNTWALTLINKAVYENNMENLRIRIYVNLVSNEKD